MNIYLHPSGDAQEPPAEVAPREEKIDRFNVGLESSNAWLWLIIGNIFVAVTALWPGDPWDFLTAEVFVGFDEPGVFLLVVVLFGFGFELKVDLS